MRVKSTDLPTVHPKPASSPALVRLFNDYHAATEQYGVIVGYLKAAIEVLPVDLNTARRFGALKQALTAAGRTKADIDLHIAAATIEAGATLVTNDGALLAGDIPELSTENWI